MNWVKIAAIIIISIMVLSAVAGFLLSALSSPAGF